MHAKYWTRPLGKTYAGGYMRLAQEDIPEEIGETLFWPEFKSSYDYVRGYIFDTRAHWSGYTVLIFGEPPETNVLRHLPDARAWGKRVLRNRRLAKSKNQVAA
jgi:hypothetical protein